MPDFSFSKKRKTFRNCFSPPSYFLAHKTQNIITLIKKVIEIKCNNILYTHCDTGLYQSIQTEFKIIYINVRLTRDEIDILAGFFKGIELIIYMRFIRFNRLSYRSTLDNMTTSVFILQRLRTWPCS